MNNKGAIEWRIVWLIISILVIIVVIFVIYDMYYSYIHGQSPLTFFQNMFGGR